MILNFQSPLKRVQLESRGLHSIRELELQSHGSRGRVRGSDGPLFVGVLSRPKYFPLDSEWKLKLS